jgi:hypothetical protein
MMSCEPINNYLYDRCDQPCGGGSQAFALAPQSCVLFDGTDNGPLGDCTCEPSNVCNDQQCESNVDYFGQITNLGVGSPFDTGVGGQELVVSPVLRAPKSGKVTKVRFVADFRWCCQDGDPNIADYTVTIERAQDVDWSYGPRPRAAPSAAASSASASTSPYAKWSNKHHKFHQTNKDIGGGATICISDCDPSVPISVWQPISSTAPIPLHPTVPGAQTYELAIDPPLEVEEGDYLGIKLAMTELATAGGAISLAVHQDAGPDVPDVVYLFHQSGGQGAVEHAVHGRKTSKKN